MVYNAKLFNMAKRKNNQPEAALQKRIFKEFADCPDYFVTMPEIIFLRFTRLNFTGSSHGRFHQSIGARANVPDLCLPVKVGNYGSLYIELKAPGSKPSKEQVSYMKDLDRLGNCCSWADSFEKVVLIITMYLKTGNVPVAWQIKQGQ